MTQSTITSITYRPKDIEAKPEDHFARVPLETTTLIAGYGIAGDAKGGHPNRQLNVMCAESLADLSSEGYDIVPGQMGEQIVVSGCDIGHQPDGTKVRFGADAVIEIVEARNGCDRFQHIQGKRPAEQGQLGVMCRVLTGGIIKVGDPVTILSAETV